MILSRLARHTLGVLALTAATVFFSSAVFAMPDFRALSSYPGPDILADAIDIQRDDAGVCILKASGTLVCARVRPDDRSSGEDRWDFEFDVSSLSRTLNHQIAEFSLGDNDLCALGSNGRLTCANSQPPVGSFRSLSNISGYGRVCAIGTDSLVQCWSDNQFGQEEFPIPSEATYLKQVDVHFNRFCGINLEDTVVCWGEVRFAPPAITPIRGLDEYFGNVDPATIGQARMISLGEYAACVVRLNGEVDCFGSSSLVPAYNALLAGRRYNTIQTSGYLIDNRFPRLAVCGETVAGTRECLRVDNEDSPGHLVSALPLAYEPRLVSGSYVDCLLDTSNLVVCYPDISVPDEPQQRVFSYPFPQEPANLRRADYASNATELFWGRPVGREPVSFYEIYRDNQLLATTENFSYIDLAPQTISSTYTVRPVLGNYAGFPAVVLPEGTTETPPANTNGVAVEGNTISWPADGWYQVQSAVDYSTICEGGTNCVVNDGLYNVINLTDGRRFENIQVGTNGSSTGPAPTGSNTTGSGQSSGYTNIIITGDVISWIEPGWYQVQDAHSYQAICEGTATCNTGPGVYTVINLTTGERFESVRVGS